MDIHAHVLPGIDDGPEDLNESLALARAAAGCGIATIASTPHLRPDFPDVHVHELADRCEAMREAIDRDGIPIRLVCGAEVSLTWAIGASDQELALASYGQRGTDLLIETPTVSTLSIDRFLEVLQTKGYRLTLGHPERNLDFQRDDSRLREVVAKGVLLQVNADSLLGLGEDRGAKRLARHLLTEGLAHVIGSDGHRAALWRPVTQLQEAVRAAVELAGPGRAQWMTQAAPSAILEGDELPEPPVAVPPLKRRRLFGFRRR